MPIQEDDHNSSCLLSQNPFRSNLRTVCSIHQRLISVKFESSCDHIAVIPHISIVTHKISQILHTRTDWFLNEDVVVESVISMKDGHKSCNLSSVFGVIWSISGRWNIRCTVVCTDTNRNEAAADQVMYKGNTLGCNFSARSDSRILWSINVGPWETSTKISSPTLVTASSPPRSH